MKLIFNYLHKVGQENIHLYFVEDLYIEEVEHIYLVDYIEEELYIWVVFEAE